MRIILALFFLAVILASSILLVQLKPNSEETMRNTTAKHTYLYRLNDSGAVVETWTDPKSIYFSARMTEVSFRDQSGAQYHFVGVPFSKIVQ